MNEYHKTIKELSDCTLLLIDTVELIQKRLEQIQSQIDELKVSTK